MTVPAEPMTPEEEWAVYDLQVFLRAVKTCVGCERQRPVAEFRRYGRSFCRDCMATAIITESTPGAAA